MIDPCTCTQCGTIIPRGQWQIDNNYIPKLCCPCIRENELKLDEALYEFEEEWLHD
jgi:hypothetical protein